MYFEKRTSSPSSTNKYYLKAGKGGYNRAMEINSTTHSCLPNCCGEVHGRWLESQKQTDYNKYDKLCTGNAKSYYAKNDGYKRGSVPKLGAIGCYSGGSSGNGHVLFVEEIYSNGDFLSSNSGYNGTRFFTRKITKSSGYSFGSNYKFQGFIYPPVDFTDDLIIQPVPRDENKDQVKVITDNLRVRKEPSTKSDFRGFVKKDKIYNYYKVEKNEGYTWYQIDDIQWIANNGEWLEVYPKKENKEMEELKKQLEESNLKVQQLTLKVTEQESKINNLETINDALQKENGDLLNDLEKYKLVYTCTKSGNKNIKIRLNEGEELFIK